MKRLRIGIIYKITYPNGKIYIGQDRTDDINYFGSADSFTIRKDFTLQQRRSLTVTKTILCRLKHCTIHELNQRERLYIQHYQSNNPTKGYNRCNGQARKRCTEVWA
jgi:hypothetical protein